MIQMNLYQVCAIVGGSLVGKETRIQGIGTDSRKDCQGRLFVALKGEQFDGEAFCEQAVAQGAAAVLVSQAVEVDVPQVICQDALSALQALASAWVRQTGVKVVAVTGSNGKTTVKNMLASVLRQSHRTFATAGNFNNEIGVPLSLLSISRDDEVAVIEMGAAQVGDIKALTDMASPDVALITNVSAAHVGRFGGLDQVARGKFEIYEALSPEGVAVINQDLPYAPDWQSKLECKQLTFGKNSEANFKLVEQDGTVSVETPFGEVVPLNLPVLGKHNELNASAVIAVASAFSMDWQLVAKGLAEFEPPVGRLNLIRKPGLQVIDDSYNANPASVKAAIDVLKAQDRPLTLIIGDMAELGDESVHWHQEVGSYAESQGIDQVIAVGQFAADICTRIESPCEAFVSTEALLNEKLDLQGTVLVKGSRSMKMERVVSALASGGES